MSNNAVKSLRCLAVIISALALPAPGHAYPFENLYNFTDKSDGADPVGGVVEDATGTIYGETFRGGAMPCSSKYIPYQECGTIYSFSKAGGLKVLATFTGPNGAHGNIAPVLVGAKLYGATQYGGANDDGVVFSVNTDGTDFTLLHQFNGTDGAAPYALVSGAAGIVYGIANGGAINNGGVLFSITPNGVYTALHAFTLPSSAAPNTLVISPDGTLVGSTLYGGSSSPNCPSGCGTTFSYFPGRATFVTLDTLPSSGLQGGEPYVGSVGPGPTIYGADSGVLFSLTKNAGFAPLSILNYYTVGIGTTSGPVYTSDGTLYGVLGGSVTAFDGLIYSEQNGVITDLYEFNGGFDGASALAKPYLTRSGSLIGTTTQLGDCQFCGTIWEYTP